MKEILRWLNYVLMFLPFNGYKLVIGAVLAIVAKLIAKQVPTPEDIKILLDALASVGVYLSGIGLGHKVVKAGIKALD